MSNRSSYEYVELYKNRTLGERFSASATFIRQNWKTMAKSILYIGLPLAIVIGYLSQREISTLFSAMAAIFEGDVLAYQDELLASQGGMLGDSLFFVVNIVFSLFITGVTGAILWKYKSGPLKDESILSSSSGDILRIAGQTFLQGLIYILGLIVIVILFGLVGFLIGAVGGTTIMGGIVAGIVGFLFLIGFVAIIPCLSLAMYPIIFEQASAWEGIVKGFRLGFRYWGSTFLTVLLAGLILLLVSYILMMPAAFYGLVSMGDINIVSFVLTVISTLSSLVVMPLFIIFIGFQYTSIVEREEGVSLQNRIDDFDRL